MSSNSLMKLIADKDTGITSAYKTDVEQTYRFMNDEGSVTTTRLANPTAISLMGLEKSTHDVVSFLERPINMGTFNFSTTASVGDTLVTIDVLDMLKNQNAYPKLVGFRYFRADFQLTVYLNSQPFQAGALLMYYLPMDKNSKSYSQTMSLTGKTGFLSEVINIEDNAPAVLCVPFNHPFGYIDLVNIVGDMGSFKLDVYSALRTGAAQSSCSLTLYGRFSNIRLFGPTAEALDSDITPNAIAQVGIDETEQEQMQGIVTRVSRAVAKSAATFANIPVVGEAAQCISWIAAAVNRVAVAFGWSKPINVSVPGRARLQTASFMPNFNGIDNSTSMGLDADNQIEPSQFFGDSDQLAFDNIVTKLNYVASHTWTTSHSAATILKKIAVKPTEGMDHTVESDPTWRKVTGLTFLGYVASFFRFWHGDIRFQLRCVKTKFHSGRLLIRWTPGVTSGNSVYNVPMSYSIVWDVAVNNTISFVIPYMNPKPWLHMPFMDDVFFGTSPDSANGELEISVLNPLVASTDLVTDTARIIYEMAGEPGFSFGHPVDNRLIPITTDDPIVDPGFAHASKLRIGEDVIPIERILATSEDMENSERREGSIAANAIAQIGQPVNPVELVPDGTVKQELGPEKLSMGEKIVSFRQLIKRFGFYRKVDHSVGVAHPTMSHMVNSYQYKVELGEAGDDLDVMQFDPFNFNYPPPQGGSQQPFGSDLLTSISAIFMYYRGGVRIKMMPHVHAGTTSKNPNYVLTSAFYDGTGTTVNEGVVGGALAFLDDHSASILSYLPIEGVIETQAPYYYKTAYHGLRVDPGYGDKYLLRYAVVVEQQSADTAFLLWRAAADDFDFIFPIGVPSFMLKRYDGADP